MSLPSVVATIRRRSLPRPSLRTQRLLTRALQAVLVAVVVYGVVYSRPKAITNGCLALAVTVSPALLERNYAVPLDPWLGLWITFAVLAHTLGSAGLYATVGWWDHLTHALSATIVAGVGYTVTRALDVHHDDIQLPRRFAFAFILVLVMAFGVVWELFEFGLDVLAAQTGVDMPLAQHGIDDTIGDLLFNTAGAVVVAVFGQAYLSGAVETLLETFEHGSR